MLLWPFVQKSIVFWETFCMNKNDSSQWLKTKFLPILSIFVAHNKIETTCSLILNTCVFCFVLLLFFSCIQDGQRGHLEGLASVYVELLDAPFNEVLSGLENARLAAWAEQSPQHRTGMFHHGHRGSSSQGSLPNSHSQPIYVPGKYSVSKRRRWWWWWWWWCWVLE